MATTSSSLGQEGVGLVALVVQILQEADVYMRLELQRFIRENSSEGQRGSGNWWRAIRQKGRCDSCERREEEKGLRQKHNSENLGLAKGTSPDKSHYIHFLWL